MACYSPNYQTFTAVVASLASLMGSWLHTAATERFWAYNHTEAYSLNVVVGHKILANYFEKKK